MKTHVEKPWGHETIWAKTADYVGKVLYIKSGHKLSLQYHKTKEETIYLFSGEMLFTVEEKGVLVEKRLQAGDEYHIPPGTKHRMEAVKDCQVFEVSTPQLDDVVRLEDAYGRTSSSPDGAGSP